MTQATIARDEAGIRETMAAYNAALNGGKTAAVLPLYAEDGVFMPPYSQSAVGKSAVTTAYDKVFEELQFDVKFTIAELVIMASNWAYARTNSAGTRHSTEPRAGMSGAGCGLRACAAAWSASSSSRLNSMCRWNEDGTLNHSRNCAVESTWSSCLPLGNTIIS